MGTGAPLTSDAVDVNSLPWSAVLHGDVQFKVQAQTVGHRAKHELRLELTLLHLWVQAARDGHLGVERKLRVRLL